MINKITEEDINLAIQSMAGLTEKFNNKKILITGHTGFIGSNLCAFFYILNHSYHQNVSVTCIDNNIVNLDDLTVNLTDDFKVIEGDIGEENLQFNDYDYIIHCAGIASPTFYRRFPLETMRVNTILLWRMLESIDNNSRLKGFLYFSSSEVYGSPTDGYVPTDENYHGNVSCIGPRACYDESKRLGETIVSTFVREKNLPLKIVRPFNVYGPFMRIDDRRVVPDFVRSGLESKKIEVYSDGTPTRSFCYVSDALEGFLRVLLLGEPGRPYNIGNDEEISIQDLSQKIATVINAVINNDVVVVLRSNAKDANYLTDNPRRRCPDISRAKVELNYLPKIKIDVGLRRSIKWYRDSYSHLRS